MTQEVFREFGDDREPTCCQMVMTRVWSSPPAVKFKGSGFYSTGG
jgi:predicted nucleic acid-binding Zn ribbon protein